MVSCEGLGWFCERQGKLSSLEKPPPQETALRLISCRQARLASQDRLQVGWRNLEVGGELYQTEACLGQKIGEVKGSHSCSRLSGAPGGVA